MDRNLNSEHEIRDLRKIKFGLNILKACYPMRYQLYVVKGG